MKTPLRYQVTEFDCGSVTAQNAIGYLYEREEVPASLMRALTQYTLDCYDEQGNIGIDGAKKEAINYLFHWLNNYINRNISDIESYHLLKDEVTMGTIKECISKHGCALVKTMLDGNNYVLVTNVIENNVYLFDPYYAEEDDLKPGIKIVNTEPLEFNRIVDIARFDSIEPKDYSLGPIEERECVIMNRR